MARSSDFTQSRTQSAAPAGRGFRQADADAEASLDSLRAERPRGRSYVHDSPWRTAALVGAGVAVGALLGAGAALLLAPQSGEDTRELLSERAQQLGGRVSERFDDVRDDLGWYLRRGRRKLGRGLKRGRWAGEDVADRVRKRF